MSDLIDRQAAIDEIDEWIKAFRENGHKESAADACLIQDGIIQLPSAQTEADLVAVVRCKDCKYNSCSPDRGNACCDMFYGMTDQMGYCHYGERREE